MAIELFRLSHGALWLIPDGRVIKIQGFHDSWLRAHSALASGAKNTVEFVQKSGWISAVLHDQGFCELIIRSRTEDRLRQAVWNILSTNQDLLNKVVIMVVGLEGCLVLGKAEIESREAFERALDSAVFS